MPTPSEHLLSNDSIDALIGEIVDILEVFKLLAHIAEEASLDAIPEIVAAANDTLA